MFWCLGRVRNSTRLTRGYASLQDNLRKVNTCHLKLEIPSAETGESRLEAIDGTDDNDGDLGDEGYRPPVNAPRVTDEDVSDAIKSFVTRPKATTGSKPPGQSSIPEPDPTYDDLHKYDELSAKLTHTDEASILPERFVRGMRETPYDQMLLNRGEDLAHPQNNARLSVTKILPYNWCELRDMYRVYEGLFERQRTEAMLRGTIQHGQFEKETHPSNAVKIDETKTVEVEETRSFAPEPEIDQEHVEKLYQKIEQSNEHVDPALKELAGKWTTTILRLLTLFQFGECREVLVHALYNRSSSRLLVEPPFGKSSEYVIVSGVIDHLVLYSDNPNPDEDIFDDYQDSLRQSIGDNCLDISQIVSNVKEESRKWCVTTEDDDRLLYVVVKDLKTRAKKSLPHPYQQRSAQYQVGMYRKFLGLLGPDPELTYHSLLANAEKRGLDTHKPLPETLVSELMLQNYYLIRDFERLRLGKPIGFEPFDSTTNGSHRQTFSMTLQAMPKELTGEWKTAPTLAYLAGRLAQMYNCLDPFLSSDTYVEYSCEGKVFSESYYRYDERDVDNSISTGMDLWMGRREPTAPFFKGMCNKCDFKHQCEWHLRQEGQVGDL